MSEEKRVYMPADTESLLPYLQGLYKADELVALNLQGKHTEAMKLAAKIEMINELIQIWTDEKKEVAEARNASRA